MSAIVLERQFDTPVGHEDFVQMAMDSATCMPLYRVEWRESLLAEDGSRLLCRFEAPDSQAVRMVARNAPARASVAWPGTLHDTGREECANVVVERSFEEPVSVEELQAVEDAGAWCMELHRVTFLRTFFSQDRKRMLCLYHAPDAESVRQAQRKAGMPTERVWSCLPYNPATFQV